MKISADHKCGLVALIGPPNAGKSTLLNEILGQKIAIVTPKPQTTRNQITGILSEPDAQVVFFDTPGIHRRKGKLNRALLQTAWQALASAQLIVLVLDGHLYAEKPNSLDRDVKSLSSSLQESGLPLFIAVNKVDRLKDKKQLLPLLEQLSNVFPEAELFPVSALAPHGLDVLLKRIKTVLPFGPPMFPEDQASTISLRFMVSEIIREKLFLSLQQELPYGTAVEIEKWEEIPERNQIQIHTLIYVASKSHKGMVIGKSGANLKSIGTQARGEISELLESKVHLEMWVKVRDNWTEDPGFLRMLGLGE
ncbi:MAG: GTPase Era [Desulfovibrio sp.]|nr:MAG: GTPase Era [Desulfovibrio sp.]